MPAPVSEDLRLRVVAAYRAKEGSYRELAARFSVATSSVSRWLRGYRETGGVEPKPHGGGRKRLFSDNDETYLRKLVEAHPDWSEAEYAADVRAKRGVQASDVTVGRVVRKLGYSVKKKRSSLPSATDPGCSSNEVTGPNASETSPLRVWFLWTKRARTSR